MNPAASPGVPYTVPPEPSRLPAVLLAVAMHALLLGFLYVGVNWQNTEPVTVEAEVWDMRVQDAAPAPAPEPPPPPPQPAPEPEPAPPPPRPEPVKEAEPPPAPKPDIALERKKQKELEEKLLKEKQLKEERLAEEKRRKEELKKKEQEKKLAEKKEQEKKLAEEKKQKELAEKKEKEKAEKLAKAKAAEEQKRLDKLRAEQIARITGAAGSGTAAQSTAPRVDEGYKLAIQNKIKNNTTYLGSPENNPRVEFRVEQLPTGEIVSVRMTKSSGIPAFDEAVEKGIMKSSPLPKKKDGTVERTVTVGYRPKDLD